MEGESASPEATLFPAKVGEKLRNAREAKGIELSDVAARTRVPQRHLEAIERSDYTALPSITYALGFAKAYARAVNVDEVAIGRELRNELDRNYDRAPPTPVYETSDPTRNPPSAMVWIGLLIAVLVLVGAGLWYGTDLFRGPVPDPETLVEATPTPTPTAATAPTGDGQVTLVALGTAWVRVSDAAGNTLFEKEMKAGDRYDVPRDADHPVAKTARADQIQLLLNGSNFALLGPGNQTVEAGVSAAALTNTEPTPSPTPIATTASVVRPTPAPSRAAPEPRPSPTRSAIPARVRATPSPTPFVVTRPAPAATQAPAGDTAP